MGRARVGLALGAAGGAMGGLVLHFICPYADTAHVVLGHLGGAILAAAAGAALFAAALRRWTVTGAGSGPRAGASPPAPRR
jgi:hypothetical protein